MGKIYFNINNEQINYLENSDVSSSDLLLSDMAGKIVLTSINNIKFFPCFDPFKENEETIKKLIKTGYKPVNAFMASLVAQNYHFCPFCGEDIDIEEDSQILILDVGTKLANLTEKKLNPFGKELTCSSCGHSEFYYFDIFADTEDKNAFAKRALDNGADIYIKYRYLLGNDNKMAWVPIIFDFTQFMQFFNNDDESQESDMIKELKKSDDKTILKMLFNEELHRFINENSDNALGNIRVELKPIEIGAYNQYTTKKDFETIQIYNLLSENYDRLKELIIN